GHRVDRADVLEPRCLGAGARLVAAALRRPHDPDSLLAQDGADGGAHLAGMQQADRAESHYTGTLTIVRVGGFAWSSASRISSSTCSPAARSRRPTGCPTSTAPGCGSSSRCTGTRS